VPLSLFCSSWTVGLSRINVPSTTGKKPKVPNAPDVETVPLAFCNAAVSAFTRHLKIDSALPQPAAAAKSW